MLYVFKYKYLNYICSKESRKLHIPFFSKNLYVSFNAYLRETKEWKKRCDKDHEENNKREKLMPVMGDDGDGQYFRDEQCENTGR